MLMSDAATASQMEQGSIQQAAAAAAAVPTCCFGGKLTPNTKVLLVAMGSFSVITFAQVPRPGRRSAAGNSNRSMLTPPDGVFLQIFAAIASHSNALMADCVSMGVDAVSYGVSAMSEAWPDDNRHRHDQPL